MLIPYELPTVLKSLHLYLPFLLQYVGFGDPCLYRLEYYSILRYIHSFYYFNPLSHMAGYKNIFRVKFSGEQRNTKRFH